MRDSNSIDAQSRFTRYYGTSFQTDGRIAAGAGFNFFMWAAGRGATAAPPLPWMDDYATEGWMSMSTGGVPYHLAAAHNLKPAEPKESPPLPECLKAEKAKKLFSLPIEFGRSEVTEVAADNGKRKTHPVRWPSGFSQTAAQIRRTSC